MASLLSSVHLDGDDSESSFDGDYGSQSASRVPALRVSLDAASKTLQKAWLNSRVPVESKRLRRLRRRTLVIQKSVRRFVKRRLYISYRDKIVSCQRVWRSYRRGRGWPGVGEIELLKALEEARKEKMETMVEEGRR